METCAVFLVLSAVLLALFSAKQCEAARNGLGDYLNGADEPTFTKEFSRAQLAKLVNENFPYNVTLVNLDEWLNQDGGLDDAKYEEFSKLYPNYMSGHDYDGRPIWIQDMGKHDYRKAASQGGDYLKDFIKKVRKDVQLMFLSLRNASRTNDSIAELIFLVDYHDFKMDQLLHLPAGQMLLIMTQQIFPMLEDWIHVCIMTNVNFAAQVALNLARPVIGPAMSKIEVYGAGKEKFVPRILQLCPRDQVPVKFGGLQPNRN